MTLRRLEQHLSALLEADSFISIRSEGLVSDAFPDTFVPSALHSHVQRAAETGPRTGLVERRYGCERVYRHIDEGRIGDSGHHLSSFNMFVFYNNIISGEADEKLLRAEVVVNFLELISSLGIRPHDLLVTYFGGGCVRGRHFGADDEVARLWRGGGVPEDRVVPVCGAANFTNVDREGEPAGPRCEVFWCSAAESPIEIGTVVFEKFLIGNVAQGLIPSNGLVYGGAIGLERLQGVLSGATTLFELPEIRPMVKRVEDSIPRQLRAIHLPSTRELVDGVLTLVALMSQVHEPLSGGRAARLRRIGRRCQRSLGSLGITEPNLLIYDLIIQAMEAQCLSGRRDLQERVIRLICV